MEADIILLIWTLIGPQQIKELLEKANKKPVSYFDRLMLVMIQADAFNMGRESVSYRRIGEECYYLSQPVSSRYGKKVHIHREGAVGYYIHPSVVQYLCTRKTFHTNPLKWFILNTCPVHWNSYSQCYFNFRNTTSPSDTDHVKKCFLLWSLTIVHQEPPQRSSFIL